MLAICHKPKIKITGFGLIEMLVSITIIGILSSIAASNFGTWVQNTRTRAVAESLANGLRLAQGEAIKRNRQTIFTLDGKNWAIKVKFTTFDDALSTGVVHRGTFADAGSVTISGGANPLRFNSVGRLVGQARAVTYIIDNSNGTQEWQVTISLSGRIAILGPLAPPALAAF